MEFMGHVLSKNGSTVKGGSGAEHTQTNKRY
jgi:hypothetical protein